MAFTEKPTPVFPTLPGASPLPAPQCRAHNGRLPLLRVLRLFPGPRHLQASPWLLPEFPVGSVLALGLLSSRLDFTLQQSDFCDRLSSGALKFGFLDSLMLSLLFGFGKAPAASDAGITPHTITDLFSISPRAYEGETVWPSF